MNVFDLSARILLDSKEYENGLSNASSMTDSFGSKLKSGIGVAGKTAVGVVSTVASGVVALSAEMKKGISDTASYGDNIDKMSQKMGLSAETYQEWDFILQHAGTSIEGMQSSMKTLANAAEQGNGSFEKLGITQEQIANMSQEELFGAVISGLQNVDDVTERTYLSGQLLGRGATELGALLNMTAEDTEAMRQQVHELGGVMSNESVKASADYADSLQNLQTSISGLSRGAFSEFLPSVVNIMDGLSQIFSGNSDSGVGLITEGINGFMSQLSSMLPKVMDIGSNIILSLIKAISSNLPDVIKGATETVTTFIGGIIEMLPQIIDSGIQVIIALVEGIGESLPTIIPAVVEAALTIVQGLIDNIDLIIQAAITFFLGFIDGMIQAIPTIIEALPQLIDNIITALIDALPQLLEAAITLFMALIDAIPTIIDALIDNLPQIIDAIISSLLESLPQILDAGITLLMALIDALPTIIQALVVELPRIITTITNTLLDNLPLVIEAAVQLFMGIIKAIPQIIDELIKNLPEIITTIVDGLSDGIEDVLEVGKNLVTGLWDGISSAGTWLWEQVTGFANDVLGWFKGVFGIHSPSKQMAWIGEMIDKGLAGGIDDNIDDVLNAASNIHDEVNEALEGMGGTVDIDTSNIGLKKVSTSSDDLLSTISFKLDNFEQNMYDAIARVLEDGFDLRWNDRELTRLVREHA